MTARDEGVWRYPRARWRLVDPRELTHVVLWVSHILIRHERSFMAEPALTLANEPVAEAPKRTREEALQIARQVEELARTRPGDFAKLAQEYSDDRVTRDAGGSLGGMAAAQFLPWPPVLDALAALAPGQTSRVVETMFGYHVFARREPPAREQVSGARLVIGHDAAPWLTRHAARGPLPPRTWAEARTLGTQLHAELEDDPSAYAKLIRDKSEHVDYLRAGDLGQWSTHEPSVLSREIEVLQAMKVGQVAPPIDSLMGVELLVRTPLQQREQYAVMPIVLRFDPDEPDTAPSSRQGAEREAERISAELVKSPARFDEYQRRFQSPSELRWEAGRGDVELEQAVAELAVGSVTAKPILAGGAYYIVKRVPSAAPAALTVRYDLPEPERPDLDYLSATTPARWLQARIRELAPDTLPHLALDADQSARWLQLHQVDVSEDLPPPERVALLHQLFDQAQALLGVQRFQKYRSLVDDHFSRQWLLSKFGP